MTDIFPLGEKMRACLGASSGARICFRAIFALHDVVFTSWTPSFHFSNGSFLNDEKY